MALKAHRVKVNGWRKIYYDNTYQKKSGVGMLISDRADFGVRKVTSGKEGHYIILKGSILQEYIIVLNVYAPKNRASQMGGNY